MQHTISRRKVEAFDHLTELVPPLLARIYAARGVSSPRELENELKNLLPFSELKNIDAAATLLADSLGDQHFMIIGDFDADGATSTALAVSCLRAFGAAKVSFLVPDRFVFGYGLTPEIVAEAAKQKPDVIVTVDNGVASIDGVKAAKALGMKVLITDHHLAPNELPNADVIVNPNLKDDTFPSKNLAGVGVIFYVMLALRAHLRNINWFATQNIPEPNMSQYLDLVALGTVADVVQLDHNNRILVQQGLERMRSGKVRPGIQALLEVAGRQMVSLTASDLGFVVGPRLNAAGRLDDMSTGIACLLAETISVARPIALELDALNKERRQIEDEMKLQAEAQLKSLNLSQELPVGLCMFNPDWHQGVVGILASRIKDKVHRPVIAFAQVNDNEIKGSGRSVRGVHIRDVLDSVATQHPELIAKFGGHAMAAGLSLRKDHFKQFSEAFDREVQKYLSKEQCRGELLTDGELVPSECQVEMAELLQNAGPWGQGFPEPLFDGEFVLVEQRLLKEKHLKMRLQLDDQRYVDAIAFNIDNRAWPNHRCDKVRLVYRLEVNEWQGRRSVQLMVEYLEAL